MQRNLNHQHTPLSLLFPLWPPLMTSPFFPVSSCRTWHTRCQAARQHAWHIHGKNAASQQRGLAADPTYITNIVKRRHQRRPTSPQVSPANVLFCLYQTSIHTQYTYLWNTVSNKLSACLPVSTVAPSYRPSAVAAETHPIPTQRLCTISGQPTPARASI